MKKVLMLTHSAGFKYSYLPFAEVVIKKIGKESGAFETTTTQDCSSINAENLKSYDALIFATSGELPMGYEQKRALIDFVKVDGKGFVGIHNAADTFHNFPPYGEMIGGYFNGHPWSQKVDVIVEDINHPSTSHLDHFERDVPEEIYTFRNWSRKNTNVLLSLDNNSVDLKKGIREDNDYALAWCHNYGKGRVFYTSLGYYKETWKYEKFRKHLLGGIQWAMGPGVEITDNYLGGVAKKQENLKAPDFDHFRMTTSNAYSQRIRRLADRLNMPYSGLLAFIVETHLDEIEASLSSEEKSVKASTEAKKRRVFEGEYDSLLMKVEKEVGTRIRRLAEMGNMSYSLLLAKIIEPRIEELEEVAKPKQTEIRFVIKGELKSRKHLLFLTDGKPKAEVAPYPSDTWKKSVQRQLKSQYKGQKIEGKTSISIYAHFKRKGKRNFKSKKLNFPSMEKEKEERRRYDFERVIHGIFEVLEKTGIIDKEHLIVNGKNAMHSLAIPNSEIAIILRARKKGGEL